MGELVQLPVPAQPLQIGNLPRIYSPEEVADRYDWDVKVLRRLARQGAPCLRHGRWLAFTEEDVAYIRERADPKGVRDERLAELITHGMLRYRDDPRPGFVYFIAHQRIVKIGFATDPDRRLAEIQYMSPVRLTLMARYPGTMWEEQALHAHFAKLRLHGEWFRLQDDLEDFMWSVPTPATRQRQARA